MRNSTVMLSALLFAGPNSCPPQLPNPGSGDVTPPPAGAPTVGVLFSSYGDVDAPEEIKELVTNTVSDKDIVPLPEFLGGAVAHLGWQWVKDGITAEYAELGFQTGFRDTARAQGELVAEGMRSRGVNAKAYSGFTMTFPYVSEALDEARADGIEKLVVIYQGAQYSQVTTYIVWREVRRYLEDHPNWDVEVIGVRSFSDDPRFVDLLLAGIRHELDLHFPEATDDQLCIFLPMHGNVMHWVERGDPYLDEVLRVVAEVEAAFPNAYVSYGFQNHDEIPWTAWTEPNTDTALDIVAEEDCPYVLIDGRISFTVDSLETLYDHAIAEPDYLLEQAAVSGETKTVVVSPMWNLTPGFVQLMADIAVEALDGQGRIEDL